MAGVFAITTANDRLSLVANGRGESVFTVINTTGRPVRGLAKLKALGNTKQEWLKLAGENERDFAGGGTEQFLVEFNSPPNNPPGSYGFRLDVVSTSNPDKDFTEGPTVTAEVLPPKPKAPSKAWMMPVVLIAVLVIAGAVLLIVTRKSVEAPRPPAKPVVRIVTLGHQEAGKTTLTSAITKVLAKTGQANFAPYAQLAEPPETKVQGVTVEAAQVEYDTDKAHYIHVDCHTHSDYVKLLTSDGAILDGAILVVSAADGPMPQTREHIQLAQKKGIKSIVVYLNKVDLNSDPELLQLVELEITELLALYDYEGDKVTLIRGSALMALNDTNDKLGKDSIIDLLKALDKYYVK